jgi:haloacetate dehalogenase
MYTVVDRRRATAAWRYFFLVQPYDLPERLIGADRDRYLEWTLAEWCGTDGALPEAVLGEYRRCFTPATVHATCEDYRAGASVDLEHDRADADANLACPTLVLWSRHGLGALYDVLGIWRRRAPVLHGRGLDCGHFLAEERPDEVTEALDDFLTG